MAKGPSCIRSETSYRSAHHVIYTCPNLKDFAIGHLGLAGNCECRAGCTWPWPWAAMHIYIWPWSGPPARSRLASRRRPRVGGQYHPGHAGKSQVGGQAHPRVVVRRPPPPGGDLSLLQALEILRRARGRYRCRMLQLDYNYGDICIMRISPAASWCS